jgi:hypothetical protein
MNFPLTLSDISIWLAITAIILLITSELLNVSPEYSRKILVDKTRMRFAGIGVGLAFLITVALRFA